MNFKRFFSVVLAFVMLTVCSNAAPIVLAETRGLSANFFGVSAINDSKDDGKLYSGRVNGTNVNIRAAATTKSNSLGTLSKGDTVIIHGEVIDGSDGLKWLKIEFENGFAYICADYISDIREKTPPVEYVPDATFEENMTRQKFPESYKELLRQLYANHPNWMFVADHLDITWEEALAAESDVGKSLVSNSRPDSYKSMEYGAYNWAGGTYIGFDGSNWVTAHKDIVAYFMDPRNFLNDNGIYQFLDQSYDENLQNLEGINKIIAGTFMANEFPENTYDSYAELLLEAGKISKVSPYVLSAMIIQEQGRNGTSGLISGNYEGYEGYYNHFNVGAYSKGGLTAVQRGLKYAKGEFSSDSAKEKYGLPWDSIVKSILGGSKVYGSGYIDAGQDTLYYKKFDFIGPSYYNHQYMSNIEGANSEARLLKAAYADVPAEMPLMFSIPVFKNMPEENKTSLPAESGANNYYLTSISVDNLSLTPSFDMYNYSYELVVDTSVTEINVVAKADEGATVAGTGVYELEEGDNTIKLTVTAASGKTQEYVLSVARRAGGEISMPEPTVSSDGYNFGSNVTGVQPGTSVDAFKSKIYVTGGTMKLFDKNGKEKTSGNIATGDKIVVYSKDNNEHVNKDIVVYGDISGDGKISIIDLANVQKHILKVKEQSGIYFTAADTNKDGKVSIIDLANVQKHILNVKSISQ